MRSIYIAVLLSLLSLNRYVLADIPSASQYVMDEVSNMISILKNQNFKTAEEKINFEKSITDFLQTRFDWSRIAERTLDRHWNSLSPKQQTIFTNAFRTLVQNLCLKAATRYNGQTVTIVNETSDGKKSKVYLQYQSATGKKYDVAVDLILTDSRWKAYDIQVEGVSLADNYKSQFKSVIGNFSISKLMQIMIEKSHVR